MRTTRHVIGFTLSTIVVAACALDGARATSKSGTQSLLAAPLPPDAAPLPPDAAPPPSPPHVRTDLAAAYGVAGTTSIDVFPAQTGYFAQSIPFATQQGGFSASDKFVAGDFDGDGTTDLATVWNDGGNSTIAVRTPDGLRFVVQRSLATTVPFATSTKWLSGDFDGDGKDDLAAARHEGAGVTIDVFLSTGSGFQAPSAWTTCDGGWSDEDRWAVGDFDGDHRADIATIWNDDGQNAIAVRYAMPVAGGGIGGRFATVSGGTQKGGWLASTKWFAGDFDGDHRSDLAAVWNDGGFVSISVLPKQPAQGEFGDGQAWVVRTGGFSDGDGWAVGDFDGDGLADLAGVWNDQGRRTIAVRQSTGTGFLTEQGAHQDGVFDPNTSYCAGRFLHY